MSEQTKKKKKKDKKKKGLLGRLQDRKAATDKAVADLNNQFNSNF